jgi:hypothetical protein
MSFISLTNGTQNIMSNSFTSSMGGGASISYINQGKPRVSKLSLLAGYEDESTFFKIFKIAIKTFIIFFLFGTIFLIMDSLCSENGCQFRLLFINLLIFVICMYVLFRLI